MDRCEIALSSSGGLVAIINADDFERRLFCEFADGYAFEGRICDRTWKASVKSHTTYAVCIIQHDRKLRELRLHRLVMCARGLDVIDHRDGNGLNNWRTNLRFVTSAENTHNRSAYHGTSAFKGVALHKQTNKWESAIRHLGRKQHLGLFANEVEAAKAYDARARELFGETALLNFPTTTTK